MSQIDKMIIATKQLFDQRDEQILAISRDKTLFQAAITFNLAIKEFETREREKLKDISKNGKEKCSQSSEQFNLDTRVSAKPPSLLSAKKIIDQGRKVCTCGGRNKNCTKCDGRGWIDSGATSPYVPTCSPPAPTPPDTYGELALTLPPLALTPGDRMRDKKTVARKNKLKKMTDAAVNPTVKNIAQTKNQKNSIATDRPTSAVVSAPRAKSGKPKRGRTKCANCGEIFSPAHKCPPAPRQPTYTNVKPIAGSMRQAGMLDGSKKPVKTLFDKSTSGTTMQASKFAAASGQAGKPAGKSHAARHNIKFIKGGKKAGRR